MLHKKYPEISSFESGRHENGEQMDVRVKSENAFSIWKDTLCIDQRTAQNTCCFPVSVAVRLETMIKWWHTANLIN